MNFQIAEPVKVLGDSPSGKGMETITVVFLDSRPIIKVDYFPIYQQQKYRNLN